LKRLPSPSPTPYGRWSESGREWGKRKRHTRPDPFSFSLLHHPTLMHTLMKLRIKEIVTLPLHLLDLLPHSVWREGRERLEKSEDPNTLIESIHSVRKYHRREGRGWRKLEGQ